MSDYKYRMSLAVPQALIPQANQLALIVGESEHDDKTFTTANHQDGDGNKYAVCSTVIKPIVLSLLNMPLADSSLKAEGADLTQAQQAMSKVIMYSEGVIATIDKIIIGIDIEPLLFFDRIGVSLVNDCETETNA